VANRVFHCCHRGEVTCGLRFQVISAIWKLSRLLATIKTMSKNRHRKVGATPSKAFRCPKCSEIFASQKLVHRHAVQVHVTKAKKGGSGTSSFGGFSLGEAYVPGSDIVWATKKKQHP
jgi:hypothetical protein